MELGKLTCDYLKQLRKKIAETYNIDEFKENSCLCGGVQCSGSCPACDAKIKELSLLLREKNYKIDPELFADISPQFNENHEEIGQPYNDIATEVSWDNHSKVNEIYAAQNEKKKKHRSASFGSYFKPLSYPPLMGELEIRHKPNNDWCYTKKQEVLSKIPKNSKKRCKELGHGMILGIGRNRIYIDGPGVTTLIGMHGCSLDCAYCINNHAQEYAEYTIEELYDYVSIDSVHFDATGGGICFGGHEPLLQQDFIKNFIRFVRENGHTWKIGIETSLNEQMDMELIAMLDFIIIDIKSINPNIYQEYTLKDNALVLENLEVVKDKVPDITIRTPLIPGYNTQKDIQASKEYLIKMGYKEEQLDEFRYRAYFNDSYKQFQKYEK